MICLVALPSRGLCVNFLELPQLLARSLVAKFQFLLGVIVGLSYTSDGVQKLLMVLISVRGEQLDAEALHWIF